MASYRIDDIEGIGPGYRERLMKAGIRTTRQLLERAGSKRGRVALAEETGIEEKRILTWVNHADLMRVKGIGKQFAELLEAAGVDSVKELQSSSLPRRSAARPERRSR